MNPAPPDIRLLGRDDAAACRELRLFALGESPTAFGSSQAQESARDLAFFAERAEATPDKWIVGAFAGDRLVGVVGFVRDGGVKTRHRGFIWGMYVHPAWRGRGLGRRLMTAMLARVDALPGLRWVRLSVTVGNDRAQGLYESLGFVVYGEEPEALEVDGVYHAERHLIRRNPHR